MPRRRSSCKRRMSRKSSRRMSRRRSYKRIPLFRKRSKSPRKTKTKTKKRPTKKTYILGDSRGIDIGGQYTSRTPKGAAKKAATQYLPKNRAGKVKICLRQSSLGRGHNQVRCYLVTQIMKSTAGMKLPSWLEGKSRIPVKKAKELALPVKLR